MEAKAPTLRGFALRLLVFIVSGYFLGATTIMAFYRLTLQATITDQALITKMAAPISGTAGVIYLTIILIIVRPLFRCVRSLSRGEKVGDEFIARVQDQALSLGPKMAVLAICSYCVMTPLVFIRGLLTLGWPWSTLWFALIAGLVAGLIMIPLAMNLATWIVQPLLDYTTQHVGQLAPSRRAGLPLSLRAKLLITFLPMIAAVLIFTSMVGYSQTQYLFVNFEKLEQTLLTPDAQKQLVNSVQHKTDPGIRGSRFFRERLGNLKTFYALAVAVAMAIMVLLTLLFALSLTRPVRVLSEATKRISEGHPEESLRLVTNDELSELGARVNRIKDNIIGQMQALAAVAAKLEHGIRRMNETVNTVMAVSAEQSSGATEQATSVQETVSIAEEIAATASQIMEKSKMVDGLVGKTLAACDEGKKNLEQATASFGGISEQADQSREATRQIEDEFEQTFKIVEWMEDIAEQTELLALNAALEAAGAGAEGRRFQVVAEATRRLAVRSAEATREVRTLVQTIREATQESSRIAEAGKIRVAQGGAALDEVGKSLRTISSFAANTSTAVREITLSTGQQSSASQQLAGSIAEISQVAAKVEEGAKETESTLAELRTFAEALRETAEQGEDRDPLVEKNTSPDSCPK